MTKLSQTKRHLYAIGIFLLAFVGQNAKSDSTFNLDSLLVQSVGGENAVKTFQKLSSIKMVGTLDLNGLHGTISSIYALPNKYHTEITFPAFSFAAGYDGVSAWQRNYNGQYAALTGYEQDELIEGVYFEALQFLHDTTAIYRGQVTRDSVQYHEVGFFPVSKLDTVVVFFEVATGKRKMMRSKLDNAITTSYIEKDTVINSIIFPTVLRVEATAADLNSNIEVTGISFNEPVADSLFIPPTGSLINYRFPDNQKQVTVPFVLENGHIIVEATVNGKYKVRFILDSGASTNIFDALLTRNASLQTIGSLPGKGVSGFTSIDLVKVDSINVAGAVLLNQVGGSFDIVSLLPKGGDTSAYRGILGYDFLSRFPFLVDYQNRTLTLYNPKTFEAPGGGTVVPFTLTISIPTVRAKLNDLPGDFIVDLGNAHGVIVHPFYAQSSNLLSTLKNRRSSNGQVGGVGGLLTSEIATVERFQIGDLMVKDVEVKLPETSEGVTGSEALAGNIGNEFLQNYRLLLDYSTNRLILYSPKPQ